MKKCENSKCNKEHDGSFGSGKYCSRSCANSRNWTKEDKEKKRIALKNLISQLVKKETLEIYIKKQLNRVKIAQELNISTTTLTKYLKKHKLSTEYKKKYCCKICGETNKDNFYNMQKSYCKKCQNIIGYSYSKKKRKIKAIKYKGGKCKKCGYDKCIAALEFHHLDPNKKEFSPNRVLLCSWEKVKKEIDKCILVCANCHREIHFDMNNTKKGLVTFRKES